jgi:hypothetical protein
MKTVFLIIGGLVAAFLAVFGGKQVGWLIKP